MCLVYLVQLYIMEYQEDSGWKEHTSLVGEGFAVTSIEYDNYFDMVWTGYANGRVTGFSIKEEKYDASNMIESPCLSRYSSFAAVPDMVTRIVPNQHNVVCFGQSKISLRGYGGVGLGSINLDVNTYQSYFTCGDSIRSPGISRSSASTFATSIVAGTSSNWAFLYDLTVLHDTPVMTYNVASPSVQMLSNGHLIVAAGYDGCLRLLDGKFRSSEVLTTLEAHLGSIKDVCLQDDGRTLISCGMISKPTAPSYQVGIEIISDEISVTFVISTLWTLKSRCLISACSGSCPSCLWSHLPPPRGCDFCASCRNHNALCRRQRQCLRPRQWSWRRRTA